jgi:hypothetical protein
MARQKQLNLRDALEEEDNDKIATAIENLVGNADAIDHPFEKGKSYLVRTVTMVDVGRVTKVTKHFIVMDQASWIADTGRFTECLKKPDEFKEVEPFAHEIYINLDAIIDATPWPYTLPTAPK